MLECVGMVITVGELLGYGVNVFRFGGGIFWLDNNEIDGSGGGGKFRYQDVTVESSEG
jgi:hypothetical protein